MYNHKIMTEITASRSLQMLLSPFHHQSIPQFQGLFLFLNFFSNLGRICQSYQDSWGSLVQFKTGSKTFKNGTVILKILTFISFVLVC